MNVLKYLPDGVAELSFSRPRMAYGGCQVYHYCTRCGGWVEGETRSLKTKSISVFTTEVVKCGNGHEMYSSENVYND